MSNINQQNNLQTATFGAGCFWHVEEDFRNLDGVVETTVGYMGGPATSSGQAPTYEDVCTGNTGHAEVVNIKYDPDKITYEHLLKKFWAMHDPTQVNQQGPDVGSQYRSIIFYHDAKQQHLADTSLRELGLSSKHANPIATKLEPAGTFFKAEDYHQQYLAKRGLSTCPV